MNKTGKWAAVLVSALMILGTGCKKSGSDDDKKKEKDNWPVEVNVENCFDVTAEGNEGLATLVVNRNESELEKEEKRVGEELKDKDMPYRKNDLSDFFKSIEFISDASQSVKNGDNVTITVKYDVSLARTCNVEFKEEAFLYTVSGLTEQAVIDPFENLNVKIEGYLGRARIVLDNSLCSEDCRNNVTYNIPDINEVANGQSVTLTATLSDTEKFVLSRSEMEVTVDGLNHMFVGGSIEGMILRRSDDDYYLDFADQICADYTEYLKQHDRTVTFKNGEEELVMTEATIKQGRFIFVDKPTILTPLDSDSLDPNGVLHSAGLKIYLTGKVNGEEKTFILDLGSMEYVHLALVYNSSNTPVELDESKKAFYYSTAFEGPYEYFEPEIGEPEYHVNSTDKYISQVESELKKTYEIGEKWDLSDTPRYDQWFDYTED